MDARSCIEKATALPRMIWPTSPRTAPKPPRRSRMGRGQGSRLADASQTLQGGQHDGHAGIGDAAQLYRDLPRDARKRGNPARPTRGPPLAARLSAALSVFHGLFRGSTKQVPEIHCRIYDLRPARLDRRPKRRGKPRYEETPLSSCFYLRRQIFGSETDHLFAAY